MSEATEINRLDRPARRSLRFVRVWPDDVTATLVQLSYIETDDSCDRPPWPTRATDPECTVEYDGRTYQLPAHVGEMVLGFDGVGLVVRHEAPGRASSRGLAS